MRPDLADYYLDSGIAGWDTLINDLIDVLSGPLVPGESADYASLVTDAPPANYEGCVSSTVSPPMLWYSNGVAWLPLAPGLKVATSLQSGLTGASVTWTGAFPAKVRQVGVTARVVTTITASGGGTTLKVGDGTDDDRYAAGIAFAAGTTFADAATADPGGWNSTARDVVLAPNAGAFTAGAVRIYAYYFETVAPTS